MLTFKFIGESELEIDDLKVQLGLDDHAVVIKKALTLLKMAADAEERGERVALGDNELLIKKWIKYEN